ncbi:hypothetical protein DBR40_09105 [Pedobacter sp. KBW01]|uniref:hypothetical protein n=1 Tax=Pedobacter sp. KBW01 TaxID=2153364 RepID=UPI000F5AA320|nr:hypothetical protein [Pedobacter sp. KBW01]RQO78097.1 hypothetical protein DBR40_09105 [Pedobacter sp. KBW01]
MTRSNYEKLMDAIYLAIDGLYHQNFDSEDLLIYMPEHIKDFLILEYFRETKFRIKGNELKIFGITVVNGYEMSIVVASSNNSRRGIISTKISITGQIPLTTIPHTP